MRTALQLNSATGRVRPSLCHQASSPLHHAVRRVPGRVCALPWSSLSSFISGSSPNPADHLPSPLPNDDLPDLMDGADRRNNKGPWGLALAFGLACAWAGLTAPHAAARPQASSAPMATSATPVASTASPAPVASVAASSSSGTTLGAYMAEVAYRVKYRGLQVLSLPSYGKIAALVMVGTPLLLVGAGLYRKTTGLTWPESLAKTYYVLNNVPGVDATNEDSKRAVLVLNMIHIASLFSFALLVGLVAEEISSGVEAIRVGNFRVPEAGHTVLLGWDQRRTPMLLQELLEAQAQRGSGAIKGPYVLLLDSSASKEEVDEQLKEALGDLIGREVVTRQGNAMNLQDLERVSAGQARSIIISPQAVAPEGADSEVQVNNLVSTLAALHATRHPSTDQTVVVDAAGDLEAWAETPGGQAVAHLLSKKQTHVTSLTNMRDFTDMLAQTTLHPGLRAVFEEVCSQRRGAVEFYVKAFPELIGKTYKEARRSFPNATVCGVAGFSSLNTPLNPADSYVLEEGDRLVLLATHAYDAMKLQSTSDLEFSPVKGAEGMKRKKKTPESAHVVVLMPAGCDSAVSMMDSLTEAAQGMAHITLVGRAKNEAEFRSIQAAISQGRYRGCKVRWLMEDATTVGALKAAGVATANAAVVAPPGVDWSADEVDSQVVACALHLSDVLMRSPASDDVLAKPLRLVAGVVGDRTRDVLGSICAATHVSGGRALEADLLHEDKLMTGLLGQVAAEPMLRSVFQDLLTQDGSELYTRSRARYGIVDQDPSVTWQQVVESVRLQGETPLGVINAATGEVKMDYKAAQVVTFGPEDRLVVLADKA